MIQRRGRAAAFAVLAAMGATLPWTSVSRAETAPPSETVASRGSAVTEPTSYAPPNRAILVGGLVAFTGAYVPSVVVAAANGNSFDNRLYLPIVGPWLDLSRRPGCGSGQADCSRESAFAALLIVDGVVQTLGALATAVAFVVPERRTRAVMASAKSVEEARLRPSVRVVPVRLSGNGYGLAAFGKF